MKTVSPMAYGSHITCGLLPLACGLWPVAYRLWPIACGLPPVAHRMWPAAHRLWPVAKGHGACPMAHALWRMPYGACPMAYGCGHGAWRMTYWRMALARFISKRRSHRSCRDSSLASGCPAFPLPQASRDSARRAHPCWGLRWQCHTPRVRLSQFRLLHGNAGKILPSGNLDHTLGETFCF